MEKQILIMKENYRVDMKTAFPRKRTRPVDTNTYRVLNNFNKSALGLHVLLIICCIEIV